MRTAQWHYEWTPPYMQFEYRTSWRALGSTIAQHPSHLKKIRYEIWESESQRTYRKQSCWDLGQTAPQTVRFRRVETGETLKFSSFRWFTFRIGETTSLQLTKKTLNAENFRDFNQGTGERRDRRLLIYKTVWLGFWSGEPDRKAQDSVWMGLSPKAQFVHFAWVGLLAFLLSEIRYPLHGLLRFLSAFITEPFNVRCLLSTVLFS